MSAASDYSEENAVDTVLQTVQSLHNEYMKKLNDLQHAVTTIIDQGQDPCPAQITSQFVSITEIIRVELDIDAKYDETMTMCNNPDDLKKLHDFSKERQLEKMSLVLQIMENQVAKIASNDKLTHEMKDFIDYVRSLDCPQCSGENGGHVHDMGELAVIENADIPIRASNDQLAEEFANC